MYELVYLYLSLSSRHKYFNFSMENTEYSTEKQ